MKGAKQQTTKKKEIKRKEKEKNGIRKKEAG